MSKKALRHNEGKPDWTLLDFEALLPLVEGMMYGATKYERDNWKNECEDPNQHIQSAFRHLTAISQGEEIDPESGVRHSGLVMCNMMMYNYHTKKVTDCDHKKDPDEECREWLATAEILEGSSREDGWWKKQQEKALKALEEWKDDYDKQYKRYLNHLAERRWEYHEDGYWTQPEPEKTPGP